MRTLAKIFALSLATTMLVAPAYAGPMGGAGARRQAQAQAAAAAA